MSGTGKTPGQAACEAFWAAIGAGPEGQPADAAWQWAKLQMATEAWEAAVAAGAVAEAAHERIAELVSELNSVTAERDGLSKQLDEELESANRAIGQLAAEASELRELVREILREVELGILGQHTPAATTRTLARTAEWRQRAGITPAVVTAGAEHIAAQLLGDPDGPRWQKVPDVPAEGR